MKRCAAILLGAGHGTRIGFDKILTPLAGKPAIEYSLQALIETPSIERVIITTRQDVMGQMQALVSQLSSKKRIDVILGGHERQDSVFCAIKHLAGEADITLIHDGARPLLTSQMVEQSIEACKEHKAIVCAQKAADTIKRATPQGIVLETLDRSTIWQMQTPQVFESQLIARAYQHVEDNKLPITDDASAVETLGHPVQLIEVSTFNLKITREADWKLLELWLAHKTVCITQI